MPSRRNAEENEVTAVYRRLRNGDWDVPVTVDRNDPRVRLLLATPGGPLIVDLFVSVDGRPFRETHENWIDVALRSASAIAEPTTGDGDLPKAAPENLPQSAEDRPAAEPGGSSIESAVDVADVAAPAGVNPEVHRHSPARDRLQEYVQRSRIEVQRDEARWLLAQWMPGPALLELRANFAADRANLAPLWALLDRDGDRRLSATELGSATSRVRRCDTNEDDWVDYAELTAGRSPIVRTWRPRALLTVLCESTDWDALSRQINALYGSNSGVPIGPLTSSLLEALETSEIEELRAESLVHLLSIPAHIHMNVDFGADDTTTDGVRVNHLDDLFLSRSQPLVAAERVITLVADRCMVEISAGQLPGEAAQDWNGQIAVGAVLDGSPLLRLVDSDNDRRLSLHEIEALPDILAGLDENADGELELQEVPVPLRLCVTQGPYVHEILRSAAPAAFVDRPATGPAPDWFVGMDENQDRELTPAEFLGTRGQFERLDRDGNGRINSREAALAPSPD